jgi:hypothetical protein
MEISGLHICCPKDRRNPLTLFLLVDVIFLPTHPNNTSYLKDVQVQSWGWKVFLAQDGCVEFLIVSVLKLLSLEVKLVCYLTIYSISKLSIGKAYFPFCHHSQ